VIDSFVIETPEVVLPGQLLICSSALPHEFTALRPGGIAIDDPDDWQVFAIVIADQIQQIGYPVNARILAGKIADGIVTLPTLQRRMPIEFRVIPQKPMLKFRCEIAGEAIPYPG
jgi:hypothetical protein